jgi:hypothetical protein
MTPRHWVIHSPHFDSPQWSRFQGSKCQRSNALSTLEDESTTVSSVYHVMRPFIPEERKHQGSGLLRHDER